jgi:DNA (cytosine-5)-methyltransferase 1
MKRAKELSKRQLQFEFSSSRKRPQNKGRYGLPAVCLFASAGIGELGLEAAGLEILTANELISDRVDLYRENFPKTDMIQGDVWDKADEIIASAKERLAGRELFLLYATPPCQGMSTNGSGKLKSEIAAGRRAVEEARNRLVIPTMEIVKKLRPRFLLLENVPQMSTTVIRNENNKDERILDFVRRMLPTEYDGVAEVLACEDFGIPQRRKRLITIYTRDEGAKTFLRLNGNSFITETMKSPAPTLREAIGGLPPLDASEGHNSNCDFHPQHRVPIIKPNKYWWVSHTPEGDTAFNNQCVNESCRSTSTPGHREALVDGRWIALKDTPIYCISCGELLPRPTVTERSGALRPLKGFHSAYRRMRWDQPARTVTQNFIYEASDNKIHPSQNRVLSVLEAMIVQSIADYEYRFEINGKDIGIPKIAEVIGESVAPKLIEVIATQLINISDTRSSREVAS